MKGITHLLIGAGAGFASATALDADGAVTVTMTCTAAVAALVPDLDTGGLLSNRITFSHKAIRNITIFIGLLLILYSMWNLYSQDRYIGLAIGAGIMLLSRVINKKFMLLITGIAVCLTGLYIGHTWIVMSGCYIGVASFLSHRTYTHSLIGLLYFYILMTFFEQETALFGTQLAGTAGYASHLLADSRIFPVNKRGVKLLLPIIKKEF
jgi:inner membrane protein